MTEGFCLSHGSDVPIDTSRRCIEDGMLTIPPTWSRRDAQWTGTDWAPAIAKPLGWTWIPPEVRAQTSPAGASLVPIVCEHCAREFVPRSRTGTRQRYCRDTCKSKAYRVRRREGAAK